MTPSKPSEKTTEIRSSDSGDTRTGRFMHPKYHCKICGQADWRKCSKQISENLPQCRSEGEIRVARILTRHIGQTNFAHDGTQLLGTGLLTNQGRKQWKPVFLRHSSRSRRPQAGACDFLRPLHILSERRGAPWQGSALPANPDAVDGGHPL
jgi:hypothetical protein